MSGPSSDWNSLRMQAEMQRQNALTAAVMRQAFNQAIGASAPTPAAPLPNDGLGLLPKDLISEAVQATDITTKVREAIAAFQEKRQQPAVQAPQMWPGWGMQNAFQTATIAPFIRMQGM